MSKFRHSNRTLEIIEELNSMYGNTREKILELIESLKQDKRKPHEIKEILLSEVKFMSRASIYNAMPEELKREYTKPIPKPRPPIKIEPIDEGAEAEKAYLAEKAYEQSANTFTKPETLNQIRERAIPAPEPDNLDVVTVGRYGLFDTKKTAEVLTRDLGRLKSSGWKIAEITARHIS